jgi:hypothetical protein
VTLSRIDPRKDIAVEFSLKSPETKTGTTVNIKARCQETDTNKAILRLRSLNNGITL